MVSTASPAEPFAGDPARLEAAPAPPELGGELLGLPILARSVLAGPTLGAARALLGTILVREGPDGLVRAGRIVEVEAYIGRNDRACHARFGPTPRNRVMFGPPGRAYVYRVYGMYDCLNVVTEPEGAPAAVLVRAVEPLVGLEAMRRARVSVAAARHRWSPERAAREAVRVAALRPERLAAGPGLVGAVLGLDPSWSGVDLCDPRSSLRLHARPPDAPEPLVASGPRVGVDYAGEPWRSVPWRLAVAGHPAVSRPPLPTAADAR